METATTWLLKLILAHLVTDFLLQPTRWIEDRNKRHFGSIYLYVHGVVTAIFAWLMTGWQYYDIAIIIFISHTVIDGWKSYQKKNSFYFITDQVLHLLVIAACFYGSFLKRTDITVAWDNLSGNIIFWKLLLAIVFLTMPAGILIGTLTKKWRDNISSETARINLANAGKWIGIIERIIVFILILHDQYGAIGLLVAAKGLVRFNEKERQEEKTEYLLIGTLLSIGLAIVTGVIIKT
jgi:Protein of unknown function (DUF3307)